MRHTGLKCLKCNDEIFSWSRHHYHPCKCGNVFVDGGFDYLRYGWSPEAGPGSFKLITREVRCEECDGGIKKTDISKRFCNDCTEAWLEEEMEE